jgi:hypothetical protein
MARYYFHITDGSEIPDETGTPLNSVEQARQEALKSASELLRDGTELLLQRPDPANSA